MQIWMIVLKWHLNSRFCVTSVLVSFPGMLQCSKLLTLPGDLLRTLDLENYNLNPRMVRQAQSSAGAGIFTSSFLSKCGEKHLRDLVVWVQAFQASKGWT